MYDHKEDEYQVDERLNNGPLLDRSCTDFLCTLLFMLFIGGFVVVAVFGFKHGDPKALFAPLDADGNFCGVSPGFEAFGLLYFQDIAAADWLPYAVCVS